MSEYSLSGNLGGVSPRRIAPISDRLLAFGFDVFLFTPVFSLALGLLFRRLLWKADILSGSLESYVFFGLGFFVSAILTVIFQTVSLYFFGGTPGKHIFKLKVVSVTEGGAIYPISSTQSLLRSCLWVMECAFLGIPFLEVLSQKERRPLHDRAAETMVVTLKNNSDLGPHSIESQFIKKFITLLLAMTVLWGMVFIAQAHQMLMNGGFQSPASEENRFVCSSISDKITKEKNRVDLSLAQYLIGEINGSCLLVEADAAILAPKDQVKNAWGYLAKGLFYRYDREQSRAYFDQACDRGADSEACYLAGRIRNERWGWFSGEARGLTAKVLKIQGLSSQGDFVSALYVINELTNQSIQFREYTQKQVVKLLWAQGHILESRGAYSNTWPYMSLKNKTELSAWLCLEEVENECVNRRYQACDHLKGMLKTTTHNTDPSFESLAGLIKESSCKRSQEIDLSPFYQFLKRHSSFRDLILINSLKSEVSLEGKLFLLRKLSFEVSFGSTDIWVQRRAQIALLDHSRQTPDALAILQSLSRSQERDFDWHAVFKKLVRRSQEENQYALSSKIQKMWPRLFVPVPKGASILTGFSLKQKNRGPANYENRMMELSGEGL